MEADGRPPGPSSAGRRPSPQAARPPQPTANRTARIAGQLVVSAGTVRKHLENAFGRLGVSSRTAAVARVFPEPEAL
ncbi:LuxR C-terminal-related transcriptional regulator [Streptomyces canus]|uniref:LuxR C-terminal-related transcriptional regulator n=1 Tax=Streptomyces canus TaxID=58343 RepID=UPI003863C553|nr:LuxR C-terminal-related transcriptional regulator [Streptomyces canus]